MDEEAAVKSAMGMSSLTSGFTIRLSKGCACLLSSIAVISEMSLSESSTSAFVKLCTAKLCLENQNKTYRDQSYPKAFPQINKRESNFPCSLAQITPDNKQRFNTHSVSLARA